jgi:cytochrome c oxidase cbb3-type subunit 3
MNEDARRPEGRGNRLEPLLDHDFDGIQEYDNRLPNWWLFILYGSIIFAVAYWLVFQTFKIGKLPVQRYDIEMVKATKAQLARMSEGGLNDKALVLMSGLPERVQEGQKIFGQYCVVCHNPDGSGKVGPNLTDDYWIHGNQPMDIYNTVTNGVPAKGMAAWGRQLGPERVESVVAYVLADIKGKHLPGKSPEGKYYGDQPEPEASP